MAANKNIQVDITATDMQFRKAIDDATKRIGKMEAESRKSTQAMGSSWKGLGGTVAGVLGAGAILYYANQVRVIADEYQNISARLKLVTSDSRQLADVQQRLFDISQETGTKYSANADSYAKLAFSLRDVGASSDEILDITDMLNKSLTINGATTEMSASFMLQFAQAMGSGVLQGDEFRAMMESNSYFAGILAKSLHTNIAGLREMSKAGELTSAKLRAAFPGMAEEINTAFAKIPVTTGRAMTALENAFFAIIDDSNKASGGTKTVAESILQLANTIDTNKPGIISLFSEMISLAAKTTTALANIGQSIAGFKAVGDGNLGALKFATMDAKELNLWLQQNATEVGKLDTKLAQLKEREQQVAASGSMYHSQEAIQARKALLESLAAQIVAVEKQKASLAGLATFSKTAHDAIAENDKRHYSSTTAAAVKSAEEQKKATEKALAAMQKKYQDYADAVRKIQQDISDRELSLSEKVRSLQRSAMSDSGSWLDRKHEAEEFIAAAGKAAAASKEAFAVGNDALGKSKAEEAVKLYDKASSAAADLNREVKDGDRTIVAQQSTMKVAVGLTEQAETGAIAVQKSLAQSLTSAAQILNTNSGLQLSTLLPEAAKVFSELQKQTKGQVETVNQEITKIGETYTNQFATATEESGKSAEKQQENAQTVGKEVALVGGIWTNVYDEATKASAQAAGMMLDDIEKVKRAAASIKYPSSTSGSTDGYARGGNPFYGGLGGYGGGDRRLILVEDGEHVIRKEAVARLGHGFFQRFNLLGLPSLPKVSGGFAAGGPINTAAAAPTYNLTLNYSGPASQSSARDMAKMVIGELQKMHRGRS
ncbi:MAG: tape measure protein [Limnohabitans sp.]